MKKGVSLQKKKRIFCDALMKTIWPTTKCVICSGRSSETYPGLCEKCLELIAVDRKRLRFCRRCGVFYDRELNNCPHCISEQRKYPEKGLFCAVPYNGETRELVLALKYYNRRDLAETMVRLFFRYTEIDDDFDTVTCVPLHKIKQRARGYNQSEYLARRIAEEMELPFEPLLVRTVNTVSQTTLDYKERLKNPENAFALFPGADVKEKRILLIDDVITTGATANACVSVLKKEGASRVSIGTFAAAEMKK